MHFSSYFLFIQLYIYIYIIIFFLQEGGVTETCKKSPGKRLGTPEKKTNTELLHKISQSQTES